MVPKVKFIPRWHGAIEGYVVNSIRRYWPQFAPYMEFDDALQEAVVCFLQLKRKYADKVDNPRWFFTLYRTAWERRLITMVHKLPRYSYLEDLGPLEDPLCYCDGPLAVKLSELPTELSEVLSLLAELPEELLELAGVSRAMVVRAKLRLKLLTY